jgi:kynurenine formamidase
LTKHIGSECPHYNKQPRAVKENDLTVAIPAAIVLTDQSFHDITNLEAVPESWVTVVALAPAVRGLEGFPVRVGRLHLADHSSEPHPQGALRDENPLL